MEAPNITVKLGTLRKIVKPFKSFKDDYDIAFEYIMSSCFPKVYQNIMDSLKDSYTEGYMQGLKDAQNEDQGNSI